MGVSLSDTQGNVVKRNNIKLNTGYALHLSCSVSDVLFFNNFIGNVNNVYMGSSASCGFSPSSPVWNSPEPINYSYNGKNYTNYVGNHWGGYIDVDSGGDGIWDNPYNIFIPASEFGSMGLVLFIVLVVPSFAYLVVKRGVG